MIEHGNHFQFVFEGYGYSQQLLFLYPTVLPELLNEFRVPFSIPLNY